MTLNKVLFQRDPTQTKLLNDGVAAVKDAVTEQERETLRNELSQFVCEGQYKDGIVRILESFMACVSSTSQLAAWISGFFGSGKSLMMKVLGIDAASLPIIWDADFLYGPRTASGEDSYVLCEINVSSVFAIPDQAPAAIAHLALRRLRSARGE